MQENKDALEILKKYGINEENLTDEEIETYLDKIIQYNNNQIKLKREELFELLSENEG